MLQRGGRFDFDNEPFRTKHRGEFRLQHFDCDFTFMLQIVREIHRRHATRAEFTLDAVAIAR